MNEETARAAFAQWASSYAGSSADSFFCDAETSHEHAGLLATEVHGRRAVWKSVPADGRSRVTLPAVTIERIDPWTVDGIALREHSDHIAVCDQCAGEKRRAMRRASRSTKASAACSPAASAR